MDYCALAQQLFQSRSTTLPTAHEATVMPLLAPCGRDLTRVDLLIAKQSTDTPRSDTVTTRCCRSCQHTPSRPPSPATSTTHSLRLRRFFSGRHMKIIVQRPSATILRLCSWRATQKLPYPNKPFHTICAAEKNSASSL
ncbi:hypothetical protein IF2G_04251 [Cordyceps javanica]|nr:hypothetical protein IF2G_04251 [Cordyceps javanica]